MKQELYDKKGQLATQAEEVLKLAKEAGRFDLTAEEEARFDAIHADIDKVNAHIARIEKQEAVSEPAGRRSEPQQPAQEARRQESRVVRLSEEERADAMKSWLLAGAPVVERSEQMQRAAAKAGLDLNNRNFHMKLPRVALRNTDAASIVEWDKRAAMGTTSGAVGLYTVPDETMRELEISMLAFGGMRQVATVLRTDTGAALPIPTSDDTSNKGAIVAENSTTAEVDITFGQIVLDSYKYSSKYVLVSVELLQDSAINVAAFIGKALGERLGRITNDHFTTGTGSGQPNGIVTASSAGVSSVADPPTYDNFVDLVHSIDPAYRTNAKFMLNDATLKTIKKIKVLQYSGDTTGVPLWSPSMVAGQPDSILGFPYVINQSMASPGSSAKKVIFGDLSKYLIRDVRDVTLLRLDERFAEYHQVAFLAFSRHDGDLLDAGTDPVKHMAQA
jgi:HK97 family phage major capsid protein